MNNDWQKLMCIYFRNEDYHAIGVILRNWGIQGTENQNGTWIDWNLVPVDCQQTVEKYVNTVVKARKEQKEWEEHVRLSTSDRKNIEDVTATLEKNKYNSHSFTYEERDVGLSSAPHSKTRQSWVHGIARNIHTSDDPTASQWVLNRVPYQLIPNTEQNQQKWKKIGNLSGYVVSEQTLIWEDDMEDPNIINQYARWRQREEVLWKKVFPNKKEDCLLKHSKDRILRAQYWMKNRRKYSLHSQKIMKYIRNFVHSHNERHHFFICPESIDTMLRTEIYPDIEYEELQPNNVNHVINEDTDEDPPLCQDDDVDDIWAQNPFQNRPEKPESTTHNKKKRKAGGGRKKKFVSADVFSSGIICQ